MLSTDRSELITPDLIDEFLCRRPFDLLDWFIGRKAVLEEEVCGQQKIHRRCAPRGKHVTACQPSLSGLITCVCCIGDLIPCIQLSHNRLPDVYTAALSDVSVDHK